MPQTNAPRHLLVVMDPIENINTRKDTSFAMMLAAQDLGWKIDVCDTGDLWLENGEAWAHSRSLEVDDNDHTWFTYTSIEAAKRLSDFDVILMRKDPPFDQEYIYATYILEQAEKEGSWVINRPQSLRDWNEKAAIHYFPHCTVPSVMTRDLIKISDFVNQEKDCVIKPLDGMGGTGIFRLRQADQNYQSIIDTVTEKGARTVMVQRYIPEIEKGDKRILLVFGEAVPYALARIPKPGELRGNLAAGGSYQGHELNARDRYVCSQIGPELVRRGLYFVGLDVIGDYITEINVTSPTCVRELDQLYSLRIARDFMEEIGKRLNQPAGQS